MGPESYLLLGLAGFGQLVAGDWTTQWMTTTCTETAWSTKAAETMWSTEWSTTTCWSTPEALTVTVTSEYEKDYTITEYSTEYSTVEVPTTIEKDFTTTVYESFLSKITSVETVYTTLYSSYAESPVTITKVSISTVTVTTASVTLVPGVGTTSVLTITEACTPTSTLPGLVPCPSRIYNEQGYTPPAPLPSTYLWGCPPGSLCKPIQIGCNFESDLYAPTYICAPEDCIPAKVPPPYDQFGGPYAEDVNSTCPFFETFDSYPLLAPSIFGLSFSEYAVSSLGIAAGDCTPAPPPPPQPSSTTSTTVYVPPPTTTSYVPPPTTTTQWVEWTPVTSSYVPPPSSTWAEWSYSSSAIYSPWSSPAAVSSSGTWGDWVRSSSSAAAYSESWGEPSATTAWSHASRAVNVRAAGVIAPAICQKPCDYCAVKGAQVALVYSALCPTTVPFQAAFIACQQCISVNKNDQPREVQVIITELNQFLNVCSSKPPVVSAPAQITSPSTSAKTTPVPATPQTTPVSISPKTTPPTTLSPPTSSVTPPSPSTTVSTPISSSSTTSSSSISVTVPTSSTTTPIVSVGTTTNCAISQISDGQPQVTDCTISVSVATYTPPSSPSVATYTSGSGAQPTQRPAAAMLVGVVAVIAMV